MTLLSVEAVSRSFGGHQALDEISLSVSRGEIVGVIGRSGAGKTTLLRCLCALERPDRGRIVIEGEDITRLPEARLVQTRRRIGLVFQHFNLLNSRSVARNVALPLEIAGIAAPERARRVAELLDLVGLSAHANKRPRQLSGGQKQRVGIARALAAEPALLLCDEATSALDPETTGSILDLLGEINRTLGLTIVLITHEMEVIRRIAQRVVVLDHGRVVEDGPVAALLGGGAAHAVTRSFLGETRPRLPAAIAAQMRDAAGHGTRPVLRLVVDGEATGEPVISTLAQRFGVSAVVLAASVGETGGGADGEYVLMLSGENEAALAWLAAIARVMEVLGHVAPHH